MFGQIGERPNSSTRVRKRGVFSAQDVLEDNLSIRTRGVGLVHHYPLTSDANDLFGTLNLTNNNNVSFSDAGALFNKTAKSFLSASVTWPAVFTWVWDVKIVTCDDSFSIGHRTATTGVFPMCVNFLVTGGVKKVGLTYYTASNGAAIDLQSDFNFDDGVYHRMGFCGVTSGAGGFTALYLDGGIRACVQLGAYAYNNTFSIGRAGAANWGYADAYVRDFKVFDRYLTPSQIMAA